MPKWIENLSYMLVKKTHAEVMNWRYDARNRKKSWTKPQKPTLSTALLVHKVKISSQTI
jgi:hypothetical protein